MRVNGLVAERTESFPIIFSCSDCYYEESKKICQSNEKMQVVVDEFRTEHIQQNRTTLIVISKENLLSPSFQSIEFLLYFTHLLILLNEGRRRTEQQQHTTISNILDYLSMHLPLLCDVGWLVGGGSGWRVRPEQENACWGQDLRSCRRREFLVPWREKNNHKLTSYDEKYYLCCSKSLSNGWERALSWG